MAAHQGDPGDQPGAHLTGWNLLRELGGGRPAAYPFTTEPEGMDSFEFNKMAGALLGSFLFLMGIGVVFKFVAK